MINALALFKLTINLLSKLTALLDMIGIITALVKAILFLINRLIQAIQSLINKGKTNEKTKEFKKNQAKKDKAKRKAENNKKAALFNEIIIATDKFDNGLDWNPEVKESIRRFKIELAFYYESKANAAPLYKDSQGKRKISARIKEDMERAMNPASLSNAEVERIKKARGSIKDIKENRFKEGEIIRGENPVKGRPLSVLDFPLGRPPEKIIQSGSMGEISERDKLRIHPHHFHSNIMPEIKIDQGGS